MRMLQQSEHVQCPTQNLEELRGIGFTLKTRPGDFEHQHLGRNADEGLGSSPT